MPTIICPFCGNAAPDLLESRTIHTFCAVCGRQGLTTLFERAARNRPQARPGRADPDPHVSATATPGGTARMLGEG